MIRTINFFFIILLSCFVSYGCGNRFTREETSTQTMSKLRFQFYDSATKTQDWLEDLTQARHFSLFEEPISALAGLGAEFVIFAQRAGTPAVGTKYVQAPANGFPQDFFIDWEVPSNASYYFYLVGYDQTNMRGSPFCAMATSAAIGGIANPDLISVGDGDTEVRLLKVSCGGSAFSPTSVGVSTVRLCNSSPSSSCSFTDPDSITGIKFAIFGDDQIASDGPQPAAEKAGIVSDCHTVGSGVANITANVALPGNIGTAAIRLRSQILAFSGGSCTTLERGYGFPNGYINGGTILNRFVTSTGNAQTVTEQSSSTHTASTFNLYITY